MQVLLIIMYTLVIGDAYYTTVQLDEQKSPPQYKQGQISVVHDAYVTVRWQSTSGVERVGYNCS